MSSSSIADRVRRRSLTALVAAVPPERPCLVVPDGETLSYGDLMARAGAVAGALSARGLAAGDCAAIWMANRWEWVVALIACNWLGVGVVAANSRLRSRELDDLLIRSGAKALICSGRQGVDTSREIVADLSPQAKAQCKLVMLVDAEPGPPEAWPWPILTMAEALKPAPPQRLSLEEAICVVFATSGTTRHPKLVAHSQGGVAHHAQDVAEAFGLHAAGTCLLQLVPLCGAFGFSQIVAALAAGAPTVLPETYRPAQAARLARDHRVTHTFGPDDILDQMLRAGEETPAFPDLAFFGHANFNPELSDLPRRAQARGVTVRGLFGMSETMALFAAQPLDADLDRRALSGGVPVSRDARARVRDPITGSVAAVDVPGELELSGPSLMQGYLSDPEATARAFTDDGWLRTGDVASMSRDGGFTHVGRMGDAMRLSGFLVNPAEIEQAILEDPDVRGCQVVDVTIGGAVRPVAFVIAEPGARPDPLAIIAACRRQLAIHKAPVRVFIVDAFPMKPGPNGEKVIRTALRLRAQGLLKASA